MCTCTSRCMQTLTHTGTCTMHASGRAKQSDTGPVLPHGVWCLHEIAESVMAMHASAHVHMHIHMPDACKRLCQHADARCMQAIDPGPENAALCDKHTHAHTRTGIYTQNLPVTCMYAMRGVWSCDTGWNGLQRHADACKSTCIRAHAQADACKRQCTHACKLLHASAGM